MSFCELTDEELQAVRRHHDMLIEMGQLELRAEQIRETCPSDAQQQMLKPIEVQMQELDDVIVHLAA
ncbi:MAG: hypothetical protein ACREPY_01215 [Rhodanobacteraceae bacterium]